MDSGGPSDRELLRKTVVPPHLCLKYTETVFADRPTGPGITQSSGLGIAATFV